MVQVPSTSGATASASKASSSNGTNSNSTSARGKSTVNGNGYHPNSTQTPLSALRSAPIDLTSVERRGQPMTTREIPKKMRPFGLQEAPTYKPTEEEFRDPFQYIKKITPEASKYGICKIIPPDSWKPDFAIDTERFHFRTRKQELNSVEGSTRANLTYLDQLAKFHKQHGTNLNRFPSVDKRPLDLYKLKKAVESRGGFDKVCKLKKWAEIGRDLGYSGKIMSSLSTSLKNSYQRWLHPYEEYLRLAKPGVHQQLEFEYGGPLTPSPANSPLKKSHQHTPSGLRDDSPAQRASDALNASIKEQADVKNVPILDPPAPSPLPPRTSGFTPVNPGGFTPVNAPTPSFTPVNANNQPRDSDSSFSTPKRTVESPLSSAKNTPEYRPSGLGAVPHLNGVTSNPLKRQHSQESPDSREKSQEGQEDKENGGRRSKRLKKDNVPTVAGSHMSQFRPTAPRIPGVRGNFAPGEKCEHCAKGDDRASLLTCESCDNAFHMYCLDPPVNTKPEYDWHCPRCLVGDGQFGFEEGGTYSLRQFQDKAADFKEGYFQNKLPFDPILNCSRPVTEDDIEREFWRLVSSLEETVTVEYGADIHSTTHGSGFPTVERNPRNPYSTDPWNLNNLPYHPDSLFRHIKSDISGMTVPWLYVGMIFSTFCWHNEDHYSYSANYQHFGSTKTWYGIPSEDAEKFEDAMREAVPELFETQPDLLFQLVTLLTPDQLKKAGVSVYAVDQRAGQFVITFPKAYHAGFNHGFNFNEAVNFAPADWEPFGQDGVDRLQQFRRQPCFSHDELLWTAAEGAATGGVTIHTAKWLAPALNKLREREEEQREAFQKAHWEVQHTGGFESDQTPYNCSIMDGEESASRCSLYFQVDASDLPEEEYQCAHCKAYTYLSRFKCDKTGKVVCLLHAGNYECCASTEQQRYQGKHHTLHYRRTKGEIDAIYQKVADKAHLPEAWEEKVTRTLEEDATPPLKVLRTLLNEGERIPYELPSLPALKAFVDRCNEWVEEATSYIVRKQQNRRKSEKAWRKGSKTAEMEERDRELRKVENVLKLLKDADRIGFDCGEITQLRERAEAITSWQKEAKLLLENMGSRTTGECEELMDLGRSFNVDMPELEKLETIVQQKKWDDRAREAHGQYLSLKDVVSIINEGVRLGIPEGNYFLLHFMKQKEAGEAWDAKAKELMAVDVVHYPQLDALRNQAKTAQLPVSADTLAAVDQILNKQREAHKQIISLFERSKDPDFSKRPKYSEVRDTMEALAELNSKPQGTLDLEKEQKRHEDWMRKGKKLFGKANAPLHILKSHMEYVLERNLDCFDIKTDKPRHPAEPASREPTPMNERVQHSWEDPRFREVFCICRRTESGMMIECERCREWYHGKCLKIARGKVKDDEKYTCPICDWRVKIPRDAARPKLEDLLDWQAEIPLLPFQPDEESLLSQIIDNAQDFRNAVAPYTNALMATSEEAETQRFYLRKIEGAEILLAFETNFFRQELHKWSPVAPEPPPILEASKSTRKPRPTKLQKLMAQHGVEDPEDLPGWVKGKHAGLPGGGKRKGSEEGGSPGLGGGPAERQRLALAGRPPALIQPAPSSALLDRSDSGTPTSQRFSLSAPGSGHAHGHHGGVGVGPRELLTGGGGPALFSYDHHPLGGIHHTMPPVSSPGAAFTNSHHASPFTRPYSASGSVGGVVSPGSQVQGIFTPGALARHGADPALGQGVRLASPPMRDGFAPHVSGVSIPPIGAFRGPGDLLLGGTLGGTPVKDPNMDKIFDDLTNQDDDEGEVPVATGEVAKTNGDVEDGGVGEKQGVVRTMEGDVDRYAGAPLAFSAEGEDLFRDSDGE